MNRDLCSGTVKFANIIRGKSENGGSDVLFDALKLSSSGDRNDPRFLRKQPGESDLSGGCIPLHRESLNEIDKSAIRFESLGGEAREGAAVVLFVELRAFIQNPGKISLAKRTERNQADPEFF